MRLNDQLGRTFQQERSSNIFNTNPFKQNYVEDTSQSSDSTKHDDEIVVVVVVKASLMN